MIFDPRGVWLVIRVSQAEAGEALFDPTSGKQGLVGVAGSEFNVTRATRFRAGADGCQELERRDEISTYPPTTSWPFSFRFRVRS